MVDFGGSRRSAVGGLDFWARTDGDGRPPSQKDGFSVLFFLLKITGLDLDIFEGILAAFDWWSSELTPSRGLCHVQQVAVCRRSMG